MSEDHPGHIGRDVGFLVLGSVGLLLVVYLYQYGLTEVYPGETLFNGIALSIVSLWALFTGARGVRGGEA